MLGVGPCGHFRIPLAARIGASQRLAPIQRPRLTSTPHDDAIDRDLATGVCYVNHAHGLTRVNCFVRDCPPRFVEEVTRSLENVAARKRCAVCPDHQCVTVRLTYCRYAYNRFGDYVCSCYRYAHLGPFLLLLIRFWLRKGRRSDYCAHKRDCYFFHAFFLVDGFLTNRIQNICCQEQLFALPVPSVATRS